MRIAKQLQHVLQTKGFFHGVERLWQVLYRFSRGRQLFDRMTDVLETDMSDVRITFCAAASLLAEHREAFERLRNLGHDLAVHGFYHSRMDYLDRTLQAAILEDGHRAFKEAGFEVSGFRCPYLNYNQDTIDVLQSSPYDWTSQDIVFWKNGVNPGISRLMSLYQASECGDRLSVPFPRGRVLEIPITAPDDEMLMERMRIRNPERIGKTWLEVFSRVYEQGELCHLLFHPERFPHVVLGLRSVIEEARRATPAVWLASISEISGWWRERASVRLDCEPATEGGGWIVAGKLPSGATMLLKQLGTAESQAKAIHRDYRVVEPTRVEGGESVFAFWGEKKPTVWLPSSCAEPIVEFVRSEGFIVDRSGKPGNQAVQIGSELLASGLDKRALLEQIDACPYPLFRLWRWPGKARGALTISADVDSITLSDFWQRVLHF